MISKPAPQWDEQDDEKLEDLPEHPLATDADLDRHVKGGLLPAVRLPRFNYSALSHDSM